MLTEEERHFEILGRLTVQRLDLEKKWFYLTSDTPMEVVNAMAFQERCLDTMLVRMIKRARLISPDLEEHTHRGLAMVTVLLDMERRAYNNADLIEKQEMSA